MRLQDRMRRMRHPPLQEQPDHLNQMLRGHYACYGIAEKHSGTAEGPSCRGVLLAQNAGDRPGHPVVVSNHNPYLLRLFHAWARRYPNSLGKEELNRSLPKIG
jgi:hypothetical protein